jgi:3-oxoacyl-(acyl-carrier-protein) synthase
MKWLSRSTPRWSASLSLHNDMATSEQVQVVVTGMGVITPSADSTTAFYARLLGGHTDVGYWRAASFARAQSRLAADCSTFAFADYAARASGVLPETLIRRATRLLRNAPFATHMVAAAALQAYVEAGLGPLALPATRIAHVMGGHNTHDQYLFDSSAVFADGADRTDPFVGLHGLDTDSLALVCELLDLRGPSHTCGGACASGNLAIIAGLDLIRAGRADAVLVTGAPWAVSPMTAHSWAVMTALTTERYDQSPACASRPFDLDRAGFVPGHGAAALLLESAESARRRGVPPLARILGGASTSSAIRGTKPDLDAEMRAMSGALQDAGVQPQDIDYVNAHAASTLQGDAVEVEAIKHVLGARAYEIPVNATKSLTGHTMTAAGVVEMVATILQMRGGTLHPTINQFTADPALGLDFVANQARPYRALTALSNGFGFGGFNACVVASVKGHALEAA